MSVIFAFPCFKSKLKEGGPSTTLWLLLAVIYFFNAQVTPDVLLNLQEGNGALYVISYFCHIHKEREGGGERRTDEENK